MMAAKPPQRTEDGGQKTEEEEAPASAIAVEAPMGPSSEEEAVLLSQERLTEQASSLPTRADSGEPESGDLPPMEDLVKRIPAPTRVLMEELFRTRFVTVKRVPKSALKS